MGTPPTPEVQPLPNRLRRSRKDAQGAKRSALPGQVVLVLQGGGALGAYQVGVYEALHEAGIEPDWVIGTSIGAINGALIAGNPPAQRLRAASRFLDQRRAARRSRAARFFPGSATSRQSATVAQGVPTFFSPNPVRVAWASTRRSASKPRPITRPHRCAKR